MARSIARAVEGRFAGMLVALAVAALTCLVFLPALDGRFLPWDDESNLVANRAWRGLGPSQLGWMLTSFHKGHWIPVTWLSFAVDYLVWGMDPRGYHLTNVLIHGANAGLVCLLVMRLLETASGVGGTARLAGAAAAALAFALHPLRVESVAWVTERRDVLSAFFFLLAILAYLRAVREESLWRSRWSWLALGAFALSLGSKSMAVSLPVVLLVLDAYPLGRVSTGAWRARLMEKAPFALLSLLAAAIAMVAVRSGGSVSSLGDLGVAQRLAISGYSVVFYLWKTLLPTGLSPLYELPLDLDPGSPMYRLSLTLVAAITIAALLLRRRWPWLFAAWAAYIVMLLPVVGIAHNGPQIAADRYTYLPCLPWALLLGGLVSVLWSRAWSIPVVAAVGCLAWLTVGQIRVWRDAETLWTYALVTAPSAIAHSSLGVALDERGRPEEAITHFRQALRVNPRLAHAENNWGIALAKQGRWEDAARHYEAALQIDPRYAEAHANLALALGRLGRYADAQRHLEQARAILLSRTR